MFYIYSFMQTQVVLGTDGDNSSVSTDNDLVLSLFSSK